MKQQDKLGKVTSNDVLDLNKNNTPPMLDEYDNNHGGDEPEENNGNFGTEWATFNVDGFFGVPQNVKEAISLLLCLRVTLWGIQDGMSLDIVIHPLIETDIIEGKFRQSTNHFLQEQNRLIAKIPLQEFETFFFEAMINFTPYPNIEEVGQIYFTVKKVGDIVEIYGSDEELSILLQTSFKTNVVVRGLREAIVELFKKGKKKEEKG